MHRVKSKHKNPDLYIERLKAKLERKWKTEQWLRHKLGRDLGIINGDVTISAWGCRDFGGLNPGHIISVKCKVLEVNKRFHTDDQSSITELVLKLRSIRLRK